MDELPPTARRFVLAVIGVGIAAVGGAVRFADWGLVPWTALGLFAVLALVFHSSSVGVAGEGEHHISISTGAAWMLAASFLFPPPQALVVAMIASLGVDLSRRRPWFKGTFNASQFGLASAAASWAFRALINIPGPHDALFAVSGVIAGLVFYAINTGSVNIVFALVTQSPPSYIWRTSFQDIIVHNVGTISIAALIAILWATRPATVLLAIIPLTIIRLALEHLTRLKEQTREAILKIANILDRRDPSTHQHSDRVAAYARLLADELGLPADQVALIYDATRLHDIGKIGMSNELLFKAGGFTEAEWQKFKQHPGIGAEVVASFPLFKGAREIILHHQEKYDGTGYPHGLKGEEIPLGSRIIAVADAYDAMRSERPYRKALPPDRIVSELVQGKGTQFDPEIVEAFLLALMKKGEIPPELLPAELAEPREEPILHPSGAS